MFELNALTLLAITAIIAYFVKSFTSRIGIPTVTGYVLVGVVLGISLMRVYTINALDHMEIVNDFALGLIGFTIGSELRREVFKSLGKSILLIALFEAFGAFLLVTLVLYLIHPDKLYQALVLGAVASATAPAATVYVIQQYKAKGPLSSTILAVVGIDDAIALMIFVVASIMAKSVLAAEHISLIHLIVEPVIEIGLSVIMGIVFGLIFISLFKRVRYPDDVTLGILAFVLINLGIASRFHLSGLLSVMAFGAAVTNMNVMLTNRAVKSLENFSPILYACFFIFGGAHLNIALFPQVGLLGFVYLISRMTGKIGGASIGATLGKAPGVVRKYIGLSLIPQVGVAIALAIMVKKEFGNGHYGEAGDTLAVIVINVLLFTTIITEIIGPILTKFALKRSGEMGAASH